MTSNQDSSGEYVPNGLRRSLRKKYAVKSTRVQPLFNGMTHRPAVLKEGYLQKPSFFRFGGRKKRWCVLRTYSSVEASLDIFMDDAKTRYKGSICLDKEANPLILVKSDDKQAGGAAHMQSYYIVLKVGKNSYHFTTDSQRELKEWSALLRQVIDPAGSLFSANIVEPSNIEEGTVNVQFTSNYIALLCPLREISIKRWRLEHIASFGQCGGILTFECCMRCSDPNCSRCSLNIKQEKPATILSLLEKMIRENPNTNEIHYERSILGDIYHCSHQCSSSPRMIPAFSDSNLTRLSANCSPFSSRKKPHDLEVSVPPPDLSTLYQKDESENTFNTMESHDSGLGTPQLEDSPHLAAFPSSPTGLPNGKPIAMSPVKKGTKGTSPSHRARSNSDRFTSVTHRDSSTPSRSETDDSSESECSRNTHQHGRHSTGTKGSVPLTSVRSVSPVKHLPTTRSLTPSLMYNKLETVNEPMASLRQGHKEPPTPPTRRESRFRPSSNSPPNTLQKQLSSSPTKKYNSHIPIGVPPPPPKLLRKEANAMQESRLEQIRDSSTDRDHPIADLSLPEVPSSRQRSGTHIVHRDLPAHLPRERAQSQSDVLHEHPGTRVPPKQFRAISKSTSDDLEEECYDTLHELKTLNPFFRLDELEYDETEGENAQEVMSNLADYRRHKNGSYCEPGMVDKVLSKVACDNVRGYAYKISIPVAGNVIYDVPRRSAPMADPKHVNPDAPPKPLRRLPNGEKEIHNTLALSHDDLLSSSES